MIDVLGPLTSDSKMSGTAWPQHENLESQMNVEM